MIQNKCAICQSRSELTVHHILPRSKGGQSNEENLIILCKLCHNFVEDQNVISRAAVLCCERPGMVISKEIGPFRPRRQLSKRRKIKPIKKYENRDKKSRISKKEWRNLHPISSGKKIDLYPKIDRRQKARNITEAKMAKRSCVYCGIDFEAKRDFQKFCSPKCRVKNWHLNMAIGTKIVAGIQDRLSALESQVKWLMGRQE